MEIGIWTTTGGQPSPFVADPGALGSVSVPWQTIVETSAAREYVHVDFSSAPIPVRAGTDLAIVMSPHLLLTGGVGGVSTYPNPLGSYLPGEMMERLCSVSTDTFCAWQTVAGFDMGFRTYVTLDESAAQTPEPGTFTLVGVGALAALRARRVRRRA